jgi:hypothetical protein
VKTSFFWNTTNPKENGVCYCNDNGDSCNGKGRGAAKGECRKITISVFQSGKIIITGARDPKQIDDCYQFITNILKVNYGSIHRAEQNTKADGELDKEEQLISVACIINYDDYKHLFE